MKSIPAILALGMAGAFACHLVAQSMGTGTITGVVSDPSGQSVAAASLTAVHLATNTSRRTTTNDTGTYVFTNMPIGQYQITAELTGFKRVVQQNVHLDADMTATVNIQMEIGTVQESVTVSGTTRAANRKCGSQQSRHGCAGQ